MISSKEARSPALSRTMIASSNSDPSSFSLLSDDLRIIILQYASECYFPYPCPNPLITMQSCNLLQSVGANRDRCVANRNVIVAGGGGCDVSRCYANICAGSNQVSLTVQGIHASQTILTQASSRVNVSIRPVRRLTLFVKPHTIR